MNYITQIVSDKLNYDNDDHFYIAYLLFHTKYRVFIKEGQKVNAYHTVKICLFGASMGFILTKTYGHLIIYTKDLKYFTLNVI